MDSAVASKSNPVCLQKAARSIPSARRNCTAIVSRAPLFRPQFLRLKRRRLAGQQPANVSLQVARIEFAPTADIAGSTHAEAEVRFIGPVNFVVPTTTTGPCEARYFIMFKAGRLQHVDGRAVQRQLRIFIKRSYLAALTLLSTTAFPFRK